MGSPRGDVANDLAPPSAAPQQNRGPRPLPLFLELLRQAAGQSPDLARAALDGLRLYQTAPPAPPARERPMVHQVGGTALRNCGGKGPTLVLVPSLINSPAILDLDRESSLAEALTRNHRVLLLDWGPASSRHDLNLDEHVAARLVPLLQRLGRVTLIGYCLGGTLAMAAATQCGEVAGVVTLASPYCFNQYPGDARTRLGALWEASKPAAQALGFLPMEVLQAAFWHIDPARLIAKFADLARLAPSSAAAQRFVALEEWANGGEPLPLPAARQLVERLFVAGGTLAPLPKCEMLHVTASNDRIVPAETAAPAGEQLALPAGHVGMIVGRHAPRLLHEPLLSWLEGAAPGR